MALELSTAGVSVQWTMETVAGTMPTTGYKKINGIKSTPDLNPEASSLDVTDLSDETYKRYIPGLKDTGGSVSFGANNTEKFHEDWDELYQAADNGKSEGKSMWMAIVIPGLTNAFYMRVDPQQLGISAMEVDSVAEIDAYVSVNKVAGWATKPTTI